MDREKFRVLMELPVDIAGIKSSIIDELRRTCNLSIEECDKSHPDKQHGETNMTIAIEELSELIKETTKFIRGNPNKLGIIEELADVILAVYYIKTISGISDDEFLHAIHIKLVNLQDKINKGNLD